MMLYRSLNNITEIFLFNLIELTWQVSIVLFKSIRKMTGVTKAHLVGHLGNGDP